MTASRHRWVRGLWPVLLLTAAAFFIHGHSRSEVLPSHEALRGFPNQVGGWSGIPVIIPQEDLSVLGPGHFLERQYSDPGDPVIDLFIAYFPKQTTGDTIHSPKHCLPGSGWTPFYSKIIHVPWGRGKTLNANFYALELGSDREVVIYWFQAHGRTVASEYWAKFYLVADSLRMNRTDGALVRVITPLGGGETLASGEDRALSFTKMILPILGNYIPR